MPSPVRIILCGALGRMGRRVTELARNDPRVRIVAGVTEGAGAVEAGGRASRPTSGNALDGGGARSSPYPLIPMTSVPKHLARADALIDFSSPRASLEFAAAAAGGRRPVVIGTTGFTPRQEARLRRFARIIPVFLSPNFSVGMNLLFHLAEKAAAALPGYGAGIFEVHHARKKDKPSGTALRLAEAVRRARPGAAVPIVSQRLGTVVGDHVLCLAGPHERLELVHRAESRDAFALGALEAALWVRGRRPGLYDMRPMLGLS